MERECQRRRVGEFPRVIRRAGAPRQQRGGESTTDQPAPCRSGSCCPTGPKQCPSIADRSCRHGRACPGHPSCHGGASDGRDRPGHDGGTAAGRVNGIDTPAHARVRAQHDHRLRARHHRRRRASAARSRARVLALLRGADAVRSGRRPRRRGVRRLRARVELGRRARAPPRPAEATVRRRCRPRIAATPVAAGLDASRRHRRSRGRSPRRGPRALPRTPWPRASNNWALAPSRTRSGRPLLACDPHLPPVLPVHWYFAHVRTPSFAVCGACFVGQCGFSIGHNGFAAWGPTAAHHDNTDLFVEQMGPDGTSVRDGDGFVPARSATR